MFSFFSFLFFSERSTRYFYHLRINAASFPENSRYAVSCPYYPGSKKERKERERKKKGKTEELFSSWVDGNRDCISGTG